ncbi:MAG: acyl-CoA dehydrogenase family protein, partial [Actinobacteria bacterium]|nr:acyl-CoA dehydrogenase family protein [Actinomycetota bacterium]
MDLQPTDDQAALVEMITSFAADRFPIETVRSFGNSDGFDRSLWGELAALGTFGIAVSEDHGGVGLNFIDTVLVHEALGAALCPGPIVAATLAAGLVNGVIDGSVVPCIIDLGSDGPLAVENFRSSDVLLVVDDADIGIIESDNVSGTDVVHPTDPTTPITILSNLPKTKSIGDAEL